MSMTVIITPAGSLRLAADSESLPALSGAATQTLEQAFSKSPAEGLLVLASQEMDRELPAALVFWREMARQLFQAVCQLGETGFAQWTAVPAPSDEELAAWVAEAPPMRGLEYLSPLVFRALWQELRDLVAERAQAFAGGPTAYLRTVNPLWHLL